MNYVDARERHLWLSALVKEVGVACSNKRSVPVNHFEGGVSVGFC